MSRSSLRLRPPPVPPTVIARPDVTGRILSTEPGETCVIVAAPGYGATTAVAQATSGSSDLLCWVGLDARMPDAQAGSLMRAAVGADPARAGADGVLEALADGRGTWLVVDGLDPGVHAGVVRDLLDVSAGLPRTARLVITAHARFASNPRALQLDESHLLLDTDEALGVVHAISPSADIEDAGAVIAAAEGWAAALVAGAAHLRVQGGGQWLLREGATELFRDWLVGLPVVLRDFLCTTAVLEELSAEPAAAVTGADDAGVILLDLEATHAYVRPIPPPPGHAGRWWRRHGLLTEYLRQMSGTDRVARNSAAADWFMAAGDVNRAMHHLVASGRSRDAGVFLTAHESQLFSAGHADRILDWYDKIAGTADDRIMHLIRVTWGQVLSGDVRAAGATFGRLRAEVADQLEIADRQPALAIDGSPVPIGVPWVCDEALLRAYLAAFHADPATVVSAGRRAMAGVADTTVSDATQLAPILVMCGLLWAGQAQAAGRMAAAVSGSPFPNDLLRESHLAGVTALIDCENGYVTRAAVRADAALGWLERSGLDPIGLLQFAPLLARANVALEAGDTVAAMAGATRVAQEAEAISHISHAVWALLTVARIHIARRDLGAALRALGHGRELVRAETPHSSMIVPLDQARALAHLAAGDAVRAERLIRGLPPGDTRSLLWARAGVTRQPALARRTLEGIKANTPRIEAERHLLLAGVHLRTSRRMAQGHLRKAGRIAHANGLGQLLSPPEPGIAELARDTALEYQDDDLLWLIRAQPTAAAESRPVPLEGGLSRGELQLLAMLPTRARNAQIADDLGVSINTIKTRLRRLYAKLGAGDRDEAIQRARERGLLDTP